MRKLHWFAALGLLTAAFAAKKPGDDTSNPAYKDVNIAVTADPSGKPAKSAVRIMDAWSGTLKGGHTNNNGPVQASWTGEVWPRAAEIIRYSYKEWTGAQIAQFQNMLRTQFLPSLIHGTCENGNKELTMSEAIVNIGVFLDDRTVFAHGVKMWRGRAPAYIYLKSDGAKPVEPPGCGPALGGNK